MSHGTIQGQLTSLTNLGAGWIMWLLVALSVLCVAVIFERAAYFWSSRGSEQALRQKLRARLDPQGCTQLSVELSRGRSQGERVLAAGLTAAEQGLSGVEEQLAAAAEYARLDLERRLAVLGTVGSNAPFVGLLGTVIGIIGAFRELDVAAGQLTTGLMAQIGEALIATAVGLLVALPAVVFFNLFSRISRARIARAQALGQELLGRLKAVQLPAAAE